jgi:CHASE3 domain sensor protein
MYYAEDYIEFVRDTEALIKEVEKLKSDNKELQQIIAILDKLVRHNACMATELATVRGVDTLDY